MRAFTTKVKLFLRVSRVNKCERNDQNNLSMRFTRPSRDAGICSFLQHLPAFCWPLDSFRQAIQRSCTARSHRCRHQIRSVHYFIALYNTGFYYEFIGWAQMIAAILLLIPRTSHIGALLFLPIVVNIAGADIVGRIRGDVDIDDPDVALQPHGSYHGNMTACGRLFSRPVAKQRASFRSNSFRYRCCLLQVGRRCQWFGGF